jgi:integrase
MTQRKRGLVSDSPQLIRDYVRAFERDYFQRRARTPKSETTWKLDYWAVFKRLELDSPLSQEKLLEAILATPPDTRTRKRFCMILNCLAKFAGLECDLKRWAGDYSFTHAAPRQLPEDTTIAEWFWKIPDPKWRWVYGMLATYGLRPHEVFHVDLKRLAKGSKTIQVLDGKTGPRLVWPFYPEWFDEFGLHQHQLPPVTGRCNADLGARCRKYFHRQELPFRLYDLRHCWAIRVVEFGMEVPLAAQQMGNSPVIFSEVYLNWISERRQQQAYDRLMQRPDRPIAPVMAR